MLRIHHGKIEKVINSGLLVKIDNFKIFGYVPKHHITSYEFKNIEDEIELQQDVYVKVTTY